MHCHRGQAAAKKERGHCEHQAKTLCKLCGWLERQQGALHSFF